MERNIFYNDDYEIDDEVVDEVYDEDEGGVDGD